MKFTPTSNSCGWATFVLLGFLTLSGAQDMSSSGAEMQMGGDVPDAAPSGTTDMPSPASASGTETPTPDSSPSPSPSPEPEPSPSPSPSPEPSPSPSPSPTPYPDGDGGSGGGASGEQKGKCEKEGVFNCIGGSKFQRCAAGHWSVALPMAPGTHCKEGQTNTLWGRSRFSRRWMLVHGGKN